MTASGAPTDWYTPEMRREDQARPERAWRCRNHGVLPFDGATYVGDFGYCSEDDCTERLVGIGRPGGAVDPEQSAWTKGVVRPKAPGAGRHVRLTPVRPRPVDQITEEEPELVHEPAHGVELDPDPESPPVDQVDEEPPELVHPENEALSEGSKEDDVKDETPKSSAKDIVLVYLERQRSRRAHRAELLKVVTERRPDFSPAQAGNNLSSALSALRKQGRVVCDGNEVELATSRVPATAKPTVERALTAPEPPRARRAAKSKASPTPPPVASAAPAPVPATKGNVHVAALRIEIQTQIDALSAALAVLDRVDEIFLRRTVVA